MDEEFGKAGVKLLRLAIRGKIEGRYQDGERRIRRRQGEFQVAPGASDGSIEFDADLHLIPRGW